MFPRIIKFFVTLKQANVLAEEAEGWIGGHYVGFLKQSLTLSSERKSPSPARVYQRVAWHGK